MTQTHINIAMLAHVDAGKTTLSEALLYKSGSIRKAGRVDNKDAFLDTNEMERNRGITIFSKQAVFSYGGCEFTLLDTPGHVDFSAEMERTLQVLDYAVLIISGADGVQGHTRTLWRLLARYDIPTFIFVNKMDQLGTDHEKLLDQIKDTLSSACVDFSKNEDGTYQDKDFYENVAVCNEKVLEAYLEGGSIEDESVREMIQKRELFPCFFGSALKMEGIEELLFALSEYTKMPEYQEKFGATVFKITRDAQGSRLTHLKVTGGVLKARNLLTGHKQNKPEDIWEEKVNQIRIYSGEKYETKDEVEAGTICAVTGLSYTYPGEGLGSQEESELPILEPVLTYELILPDGVQPQAMMPKLAMLEEEEPEPVKYGFQSDKLVGDEGYEFPIFRSELFPEYNSDDKIGGNKVFNPDDIKLENQEKIDEHLAKEEALLKETDELLARLGIELGTKYYSGSDYFTKEQFEEDHEAVKRMDASINQKQDKKTKEDNSRFKLR
mgnify:CR=1 FL=1